MCFLSCEFYYIRKNFIRFCVFLHVLYHTCFLSYEFCYMIFAISFILMIFVICLLSYKILPYDFCYNIRWTYYYVSYMSFLEYLEFSILKILIQNLLRRIFYVFILSNRLFTHWVYLKTYTSFVFRTFCFQEPKR